MGKTSIEWTDASWNPIVGCTEVSPGCANCYAARLAATRLTNHPDYKGLAVIHENVSHWAADEHKPFSTQEHFLTERPVRFLSERLEEPLHWRQPRRIFVCDMGDLFHESVPDKWIDDVFATIMKRHPEAEKRVEHTYQILTKRVARMQKYFSGWGWWKNRPMPNVWLGVSVENQHFADERIPLLLDTPAVVHFISAEPLLGPVDLDSERKDGLHALGCGDVSHKSLQMCRGLDLVICGGESGPNARPMHPDWARSLRDQCQAASVPFFFKQWGEWAPIPNEPFKTEKYRWVAADGSNAGNVHGVKAQCMAKIGKKKAGRLLDGREWSEFPK
jgi:protein gp37